MTHTAPAGILTRCGDVDCTELGTADHSAALAEDALDRRDVERLVDRFLSTDEHGRVWAEVCEDGRSARGMCAEVSDAFASFAYSAGVRYVRVLDMDAHGHEHLPDGTAHSAVAIAGLIVDLTYRQFDPDAALPLVADRDEYLQHWTVVS